MWMQLVIRKMDCVYIMYTPVFEEHVTTNVHAEIGTLRYYTGDAEGSAEAHERVLAIEEALLPPGDPELVLTIGNLAVARTAQGR